MARTRRYIRSKRPYELVIRAKEGLPFPPTEVMKSLIESALARAQRDSKVTICHFLVMSNHIHMILIVEDAEMCVAFYQELQKKITESVKRLLGKRRLNIWEGDPVLAEILDPDKLVDRLAYIYANPASADLTATITEYPGISSWQEYNASLQEDGEIVRKIPWIRMPTIKRLPSVSLKRYEDLRISAMLCRSATESHQLKISPNAWMNVFGLSAQEKAYYQAKTYELLRFKEEQAQFQRDIHNKKCLGAKALREQSIFKSHTPKKRERKIYVLTSCKDLRIEFIQTMKTFCDVCRVCYERWKACLPTEWPPGAFRPPLRPIANTYF